MAMAESDSMWTITIMSARLEAVFRVLLLLLWSWTIWPIVLTIGVIAGGFFFLVDILIQLVFGDEGYTGSGVTTLSAWASRLFFWPFEQLFYIVGTRDRFPVLP